MGFMILLLLCIIMFILGYKFNVAGSFPGVMSFIFFIMFLISSLIHSFIVIPAQFNHMDESIKEFNDLEPPSNDILIKYLHVDNSLSKNEQSKAHHWIFTRVVMEKAIIEHNPTPSFWWSYQGVYHYFTKKRRDNDSRTKKL